MSPVGIMSNGIPKREIQWKINARAHVSVSVTFSGIASGHVVNISTIVSMVGVAL